MENRRSALEGRWWFTFPLIQPKVLENETHSEFRPIAFQFAAELGGTV